MLVDSDECQKAKTVNTSICNEAHFWCKELVEGPVCCLETIDLCFKKYFEKFNQIKINGSPVLQSQIKSYPDAVRTCKEKNSSLTVPKNKNEFFDIAISEPRNQFWSAIKRLNMTHYQA